MIKVTRNDWPHWLILGGMFLASTLAWSHIDGPVPMHWNIGGEVDGYGGRLEGLFAIPALAAGIYALLLVLPRFDPGRANYASFAGAYLVIRFAITAALGALHGVVLAAALGAPVAVGRVVPIGIGLMFIVLGNVMGKVRPNYFVGIRTPWTLASARSWERTHRASGWLFVAAGLGLVLTGILAQPAFTIAVFVADGAALLGLVVYSYLEWRRDPERVPVTGTSPAP